MNNRKTGYYVNYRNANLRERTIADVEKELGEMEAAGLIEKTGEFVGGRPVYVEATKWTLEEVEQATRELEAAGLIKKNGKYNENGFPLYVACRHPEGRGMSS